MAKIGKLMKKHLKKFWSHQPSYMEKLNKKYIKIILDSFLMSLLIYSAVALIYTVIAYLDIQIAGYIRKDINFLSSCLNTLGEIQKCDTPGLFNKILKSFVFVAASNALLYLPLITIILFYYQIRRIKNGKKKMDTYIKKTIWSFVVTGVIILLFCLKSVIHDQQTIDPSLLDGQPRDFVCWTLKGYWYCDYARHIHDFIIQFVFGLIVFGTPLWCLLYFEIFKPKK